MSVSLHEHVPSPFSPGYGKKPLVYGGRGAEIEELTDVFTTMDFGENHSVLISGLRGAGKTAMLSLLEDVARNKGWLVISDDASAGLMDRVMTSTIPTLINDLDEGAKVRLKSLGLWVFNAAWEVIDRQREVKPLLRNELVALSRSIDNRGVLITIDEVSSGKVRLRELSKFAREVAHALREGANLMIIFAGIKIDLDELLKQEHTTFLRRSRELEFARLNPQESMQVLHDTIAIGGRSIDETALRKLTEISQGYPYLIQLVGDYAWRAHSANKEISIGDAEVALEKGIKAVTSRVISRVYLDLSEKDQEFVRAMSHDDGRSKVSDIAARMNVSAQYVQVYKKRLIDSGYVQAVGRGHVAFSLPYLDQYIRSVVDNVDPANAISTLDDWAGFPPPRI